MLRRLLREPVLHFVLLGGVLFALYGLTRGGGEPTGRIVVRGEDVARLAATWRMQWGRPPTQAELDGLIDAHVRDEILYREALALGLDRNDTIVRRRMVQKMEFLGEDLAATREPSDAELERFLAQHADRYREPATIDFSHVFFSRDRRGERAVADARAALPDLRGSNGDAAAARGAGDPFLLRNDYSARSRQDVRELFGAEFAGAVFALEPGEWQGPVESAYGFHLVRVGARTEPRLPALSEIRARVAGDWRAEHREAAKRAFYDQLRRRYDVVVEGDARGVAGSVESGIKGSGR